jgi:hypothetical protein
MNVKAAFSCVAVACATLFLPVTQNHDPAVARGNNLVRQAAFSKIINGKDNPSLIADRVAFDIFFRSLEFPADEQVVAESRYKSLAEEMQLPAEQVSAIVSVAKSYNRDVADLDRQARLVKDKHLPNLSEEDVRQLVGLQRQKEAMIASVAASLTARLSAPTADKLRAYVVNNVKPRVRSVQPHDPQSHHQHAAFALTDGVKFLPAAYRPPQTYNNIGMNGYGHLYMQGWQDSAAAGVYGRGTVTEDYNVYGHRWSVETKVRNPDRTRVASTLREWYSASFSSTSFLPLELDDGDFTIEDILKQTCPYLGLIVLGGFQGSPVSVPRFFTIGVLTFAPTTISAQSATTMLTVPVSASRSIVAQDSILIEPGYSVISGQAVSFGITGTGTLTNFSGGQTKLATFTYTLSQTVTAQTKVAGVATGTATGGGGPTPGSPGVISAPGRTADTSPLTIDPP